MKNLIPVVVGALVAVVLIFAPGYNEMKIEGSLQELFLKFKGITSQKYPVSEDKEAAFKKVLTEKDQIVVANTLPLISCRGRFWMRNPGTVKRKDEMIVDCIWSVFSKD